METKKRPAHIVILAFLEDKIKKYPPMAGNAQAQFTHNAYVATLLEVLQAMFIPEKEHQNVLFALRELLVDMDENKPIEIMLRDTIIALMDEVK